MEIIFGRTLEDGFQKARVLRVRELREVLLLLVFLFLFVSANSTIEPSLSTIIAET